MAPPRQRDGLIPRAAYGAVRAAAFAPRLFGLGASLRGAAAAGRAFGASPLNRSRVQRAAERIEVALPDLDAPARRELVLHSYEHLAMLAVEVATLSRTVTPDRWPDRIELGEMRDALRPILQRRPIILITGHCGNWEILGATLGVVGLPVHALYRPLDLKPLDQWLRRSRAACGIDLVDKFGATDALPKLMEERQPVAFVADQNAGDRGLFVPFFGRLASTYKTIALLAIAHNADVVCGYAQRLPRAPGKPWPRYRASIEDAFGPSDYLDQPDPAYYITARYRRAIETMVRREPDQYLWMHRAWKSRPLHERKNAPFPTRLRERLAGLPWMNDADVEVVIDRSNRDAAWLAETGRDRLP
ncbi:MAG: hypothetical protein CMJ31_09810 [Phycisphaerae bacterium]|nr:hypothetical protein [Phycisphaerae bacterium]